MSQEIVELHFNVCTLGSLPQTEMLFKVVRQANEQRK